MAEIIVYSDKTDFSAELVALAKGMNASAHAIAFCEADAEQLSHSGADKVFLMKGADARPENNAKAIANFLQQQGASAFLVGSTVRGRDIAAQVAGYLRVGLLSDASQLQLTDAGLAGKRMTYGGTLVQDEVTDGMGVATVAIGSCEPLFGDAVVEEVQIAPDSRVKVTETAPMVKSGVDLGAAKVVVGVGAGFADEADLAQVNELADELGAGVGCTRSLAEDRGWFDEYIGISGLNLKPDLYLGVALSGALQHIFGVRDAKIIAAINTDKDALIFKQADYGIVGDYKEVIPALVNALK